MSAKMAVGVYLDTVDTEGSIIVHERYYEMLKDFLDKKQTGWIELEHVVGGAKVFIRLQDITSMFLATQEWVDAQESSMRPHPGWLDRGDD